jgi:hypothetical protein
MLSGLRRNPVRNASDSANWAREVKSDADRKAFLDMARAWTIAAAKANGGRVPITQPDDTGTDAPQ